VTLSFAVTLAPRYLLVVLFLPFSALDKILNFSGAVAEARQTSSRGRDLFWDFLKNFSLAGGDSAHHLRHGRGTSCSLAVASATLLASVFGSPSGALRPGHAEPRIPYWHLWTDGDGISRQTMLADGVRAAIHLKAGAATVVGS
jgi:hypothetical protein